MSSPINIAINVAAANLSGLNAIQQRLAQLLQQAAQLRTHLANVGGQLPGQPTTAPWSPWPRMPGQPPTPPWSPWSPIPGQPTAPWSPWPRMPGQPSTMPPPTGAWSQWPRAPTPPGQMPGPLPPPGQAPGQPPGASGLSRGQQMAASAGATVLNQMGFPGRVAGAAVSGALTGGPVGAALNMGIVLAAEGIRKGAEALEVWSQRARGVLQVGQRLDQNFGAINTTINRFTQDLQGLDVTSGQVLETMDEMSRLTGRRPEYPELRQTMGFGVAYGIPVAQAGRVTATLGMLGVGDRPMYRVAAGARNAFGTGALPMRMDVLQEEAARIGAIGGTTAPPLDVEAYGRQAGLIAGMGQRYQMPGAAGGFAERLAQGLSNAPDDLTFMLRHRALDQLMNERRRQGLGTTITIGKGKDAETVDLASWQDRRIAMELAPYSPEIQEAYRRTGQQEGGGNPQMEAIMFENMIGGGRLGPTEARRLQRRVEGQPGGFLPIPGRATVETEQAEVDRREGRRQGAVEGLPGRLDARTQELLERVGSDIAKPLLEAQLKFVEVGGKLEETIRTNVKALADALDGKIPLLSAGMDTLTGALNDVGTKIDQAVTALRQQAVGLLPQPVANLLPTWGTVQENLVAPGSQGWYGGQATPGSSPSGYYWGETTPTQPRRPAGK